jgi:hypothetical protein
LIGRYPRKKDRKTERQKKEQQTQEDEGSGRWKHRYEREREQKKESQKRRDAGQKKKKMKNHADLNRVSSAPVASGTRKPNSDGATRTQWFLNWERKSHVSEPKRNGR